MASWSLGNALRGMFTRATIDETTWSDLEDALISADFGPDLTDQIVEQLRTQVARYRTDDPADLQRMLREVIEERLARLDPTLALSNRPAVVLVVGVNGVGKTTTIGKFAKFLATHGRSVVVGAADTFRAAAVEQLATWAERAGAEVVRPQQQGQDPASVAFQTVEKALPRLQKEAKLKKEKAATVAAAEAAFKLLNDGVTLYQGAGAAGIELELLAELHLLTTKPFLYVFNVDETELGNEAFLDELRALVAPAEAVFMDAKIESELIELDEADALELLQSTGQSEPGLNRLIRVGFDTLGLQTYLTAGPKEARAWTVPVGATAPEAAGVIHSDFQRGFIKAEIVSYDDLVTAGSMSAAKAAGKVRMEGKDYIMKDGDVVEFRFNV